MRRLRGTGELVLRVHCTRDKERESIGEDFLFGEVKSGRGYSR